MASERMSPTAEPYDQPADPYAGRDAGGLTYTPVKSVSQLREGARVRLYTLYTSHQYLTGTLVRAGASWGVQSDGRHGWSDGHRWDIASDAHFFKDHRDLQIETSPQVESVESVQQATPPAWGSAVHHGRGLVVGAEIICDIQLHDPERWVTHMGVIVQEAGIPSGYYDHLIARLENGWKWYLCNKEGSLGSDVRNVFIRPPVAKLEPTSGEATLQREQLQDQIKRLKEENAGLLGSLKAAEQNCKAYDEKVAKLQEQATHLSAANADLALVNEVVRRAEEPKPTTKCAVCGRLKHTPIRNNAMGGYICLSCVDTELWKLQNSNTKLLSEQAACVKLVDGIEKQVDEIEKLIDSLTTSASANMQTSHVVLLCIDRVYYVDVILPGGCKGRFRLLHTVDNAILPQALRLQSGSAAEENPVDAPPNDGADPCPAAPPVPAEPHATMSHGYVDVQPHLSNRGRWHATHDGATRRLENLTTGYNKCLGFVYSDGLNPTVLPHLKMRSLIDKRGVLVGYAADVPDAVRFEV